MRFDLDKTSVDVAYKLLAASVVPRPIAWTVTLDRQGRINAAPFSFFNVMGAAPPIVALGILGDPVKGFKDTARNILETGEFVVNLVPVSLAGQMNETSIDAPAGLDELALAGLTTAPSKHVRPPCIAECPVSFECMNQSSVVTGPHQALVIGRVLAIHVKDEFLKDAARGHVDTLKLDLVARTFGSGFARIAEPFEMARPRWKNGPDRKECN
jgi:flavin reductase (DIM6/NTAB) family NADH-FMN oxidoreductase RutF